jgi:hypothetical protein
MKGLQRKNNRFGAKRLVLSLFSGIFEVEKTFFVLLERKITTCIQTLFFTHWVKGKMSNGRMLKCCIRDHLALKGCGCDQ